MQSINIIRDVWMSSTIGYDAWRVTCTDYNTGHLGEIGEVMARIDTSLPFFMYAKIPVCSVDYVNEFERCGFMLVDTNIQYSKKNLPCSDFEENMGFRLAIQGDQDAVVQIARTNFEYSRFHLDPNCPNVVADRIKAEWVANYFTGGRGDAMIVAEVNGQLCGFLLLLLNDEIMCIDLIAVERSFRGNRIAEGMVRYAERKFKSHKKIIVGTQVSNLPSMRFYQKQGFGFVSAQYVFHYHSKV